MAGKRISSIPHHSHTPVGLSYDGHVSTRAAPHNYCGCGELAAQPAHGPYLRCMGWQPESDTWAGSALFVCKPGVSERPVLSWRDSEGHEGSVEAEFLDHFCDWNFWRFALAIPMSEQEKTVSYWIDNHEKQHNIFYVAESVDEDGMWKQERGHSPLWLDLLERHAAAPMHAMVGGGDQLYCDDVFLCPSLKPWFDAQPADRITMEWNEDMDHEAEEYYFHHYAVHYSYGAFGRANASIPSVVSWDDHDIYDGYGSYPAAINNCPIFQGVFRAAKRFYLLFQLHTTHELADKHGLFGRLSYNQLVLFGPRVAVAMPDCRSERTRHQVLSLETHMGLIVKVQELPDSVRHLVMCTTVPVVYPNIFGGEATLVTFRKLNQYRLFHKLFKTTGLYSAIFSKYGEPGLLDDLRDHWTAATHKEERRFFVEHLQMLAKSKLLRVSLIGGDVHLAATGRLYTRPKEDFKYDFRYMPQIVSSAIVNTPPPDKLCKLLHFMGRAGHIDKHTAHKMVKTFQGGARLLNERNWCEVWELDPRGGRVGAAGVGSSGAGRAVAAAAGTGGSRAPGGPGAVGNGVHQGRKLRRADGAAGAADTASAHDQSSAFVNGASERHAVRAANGPSATTTSAAAGTAPPPAVVQAGALAGPQGGMQPNGRASSHHPPELQPWHRHEAEPGALVFALRLEHLTDKEGRSAVVREYQTVVPRLERPRGAMAGQEEEGAYVDAEPFGRGRGWTKHVDRRVYTRSVRNPHASPSSSPKDNMHQATRGTTEQTQAE